MRMCERQAKIAQPMAVLSSSAVDLPQAASFIEDVYALGCYSDPKAYNKACRPLLAAIDKVILKLASRGALIASTQPAMAELIFELAQVRSDLYGHKWRADRIVEDSCFNIKREG